MANLSLKFQGLFFVLLIFISGVCEGAIATHKKKNLRYFRSKIVARNKEIKRLSRKLTRLESKLSSNNSSYLSILKSKSIVEEEIDQLEQKVEVSINELKLKRAETKKIIMKYIVNNMADDIGTEELLSKKIMFKILNKKSEGLSRLSLVLEANRKQIQRLNDRFNLYLKNENDIYSVMNSLEKMKKEYAQKYVSVIDHKNKLEEKYKGLKSSRINKNLLKKVARRLVKESFNSPITSYLTKEHDNKGITYKFSRHQAVTNSLKGKVAYVGSLANIGNVVMIDHGHETRSIFLGDFIPHVKKGDLLRKGQSIGKTKKNVNLNEKNKLYFEVRKKNVAQNTSILMNKKI